MPDTATATAVQAPDMGPICDGPYLPPDDPEPDLDRLGEQIAEISAHIQAATYRLLVLIGEFDARGGWDSGFHSCAHWLNWRNALADDECRRLSGNVLT